MEIQSMTGGAFLFILIDMEAICLESGGDADGAG
jgi:hypothetical protein